MWSKYNMCTCMKILPGDALCLKNTYKKGQLSTFFICYYILIDGLLLVKYVDLVLESLSTCSYLRRAICILSWCPDEMRKCLIRHLYRCAQLTAWTFWTQNLGHAVAYCPGWNGAWPDKSQVPLKHPLCRERLFALSLRGDALCLCTVLWLVMEGCQVFIHCIKQCS